MGNKAVAYYLIVHNKASGRREGSDLAGRTPHVASASGAQQVVVVTAVLAAT